MLLEGKGQQRSASGEGSIDVRSIAEGPIPENVLGFPPATVSKLDRSTGFVLYANWVHRPLYGGGLDRLVADVVEAVDGSVLAGSLEDVEGVLGLVVPDDGIEEGRAGELEDEEGLWPGLGVLARAGGAHVTGAAVAV